MDSVLTVRSVSIEDLFALPIDEPARTPIRSETAALLICPLPELGHTSIIVCSPINTYLAAMQEYPAFSSALQAYTAEGLIPNGAFHKALLGIARKCGIKKDYFPRVWFAPYASWGAYGAGSEFGVIGKKGYSEYWWQYRFQSALVPDIAVDQVVAHWQRQVTQFGSLSFWPGDESLNELVAAPGFSESPERSLAVYESPDLDVLGAHMFVDSAREQEVMHRLHEISDAADVGLDISLKLFPLHAIKVAPSCFVWMEADVAHPAWERLLLRSRLAKAMGRPWHYWQLVHNMESLETFIGQLLDQRRAVAEEALSNLAEYRRTMEDAYPVILENPLCGIVAKH